jgi:hypothetical protein
VGIGSGAEGGAVVASAVIGMTTGWVGTAVGEAGSVLRRGLLRVGVGKTVVVTAFTAGSTTVSCAVPQADTMNKIVNKIRSFFI